MDEINAANCLEALGHPKRLSIYRLLAKAGDDGLAVGRIGELTGIPGSTLNHHLSHLSRSGVIIQERLGRQIICRADFEIMRSLLGFMWEECCEGVSQDKLELVDQ